MIKFQGIAVSEGIAIGKAKIRQQKKLLLIRKRLVKKR